ncbi:protein shisa-4-like [Mercenaria mercenaria]|uniref:protein shisa-4-like n=1 Tax=Mercenaria mercenaria TaxID=6596 RepID=UPI00234E95EB|nr:protein shisa-4-like [Mercenaria mercenaria]
MALITLKFVFSLVILISFGVSVDGSECCRGYTDSSGVWKSTEWCSNYCCYKWSATGFFYSLTSRINDDLECCNSKLRQTERYKRQDSCAEWWTDHAWVPVLISIGCIAAITLCCFGCFKLCSNSNNRTGVVVPNAQQPAVVMMATPNQGYQPYPSPSAQNPAAYPPGGAYPGGPPPYNSGVPPKAEYHNQ